MTSGMLGTACWGRRPSSCDCSRLIAAGRRDARRPPTTRLSRSEAAIAALTVAVIGALLGGVAAGW